MWPLAKDNAVGLTDKPCDAEELAGIFSIDVNLLRCMCFEALKQFHSFLTVNPGQQARSEAFLKESAPRLIPQTARRGPR